MKKLFLAMFLIAVVGLIAAPVAAVDHDRNMYLGQINGMKQDTVGSLNWGGYAVTGTVTSVTASWTVQSVASSRSAVYSSQWTGIGGYSDSSLIQLGTESDYYRGSAHYYAWIEMLPAPEQVISLTVKPGDKIVASITPGITSGTWTLYIADTTTGKSYTTTTTYASSMASGEYIEERPSLCVGSRCTLTNLANFGTSYFGKDYTGLNGELLTVNGNSVVLGTASNTIHDVIMYDNSGRRQIAIPSAVSSDGTSFTMKYSSGSLGFTPGGSPAQWGVTDKTSGEPGNQNRQH